MSTAVMLERMAEASPRFKARIAGVFYLLTFVTGIFALMSVNGRLVANLAATACYVAVILLFYHLFKAVNRRVSLLAACFGLVGCAVGALSSFHLDPLRINSLVFFGFYCPLIGYLIFRSIFLPRILGVLMMFAGARGTGIRHHLSPDLFLIEPEIDPDSGPVLDRPPVPPSEIKAPFPDGRN
jgi:uncharacterized membrane protein YfcA